MWKRGKERTPAVDCCEIRLHDWNSSFTGISFSPHFDGPTEWVFRLRFLSKNKSSSRQTGCIKCGWRVENKSQNGAQCDRQRCWKSVYHNNNQAKIKWLWAIKRHHSGISELSDGLFSLSAVVVTFCDWISTLKDSSLLLVWLCAAALRDDQTSAMQHASLLTFIAH